MPQLLRQHFLAALPLLAIACDEPSSPPIADPVPPISATTEVADPSASTTSTTETAPEPTPPPKPVGGPHCDQVGNGDAERVCVDYGEHQGPAAPRCFGEVTLAEGPCPSEGVIGKCSLPTTGVMLVYYEGRTVESAQQVCDTIDGVFTN